MARGFEQGLRQAAQGELAEFAGAEPRYIAEFAVSGGGNAADDLGHERRALLALDLHGPLLDELVPAVALVVDGANVTTDAKAGADAKARNDFGATPMSEAAFNANTRMIDALLKAGADPDSPSADGQTALMLITRSVSSTCARVR